MKRKRKAVPADPEFVAYIAEVERQHREAFLEHVGTGKIDGEPRPPIDKYTEASFGASNEGTGPAPVSTRHVHDDDCLGEPFKQASEQVGVGGWWWVRKCRVVGLVGLKPVGPNDGDRLPPPASWWVNLGARR